MAKLTKINHATLILYLSLAVILRGHYGHAITGRNPCTHQCSLSVRQSDYQVLKTKIDQNIARVIYFQVNESYSDSKTTYAWSRPNFGEILLSLPADFHLINLYLPAVFQDYIRVYPVEKPNRCMSLLNDQCKRLLFRNYIIDLPNNGRSCPNDEKCNVVCSRQYDLASSLDKINLQCCWKISNETKCSTTDKASTYIIAFRYISLLVSCALGASLVKWTLKATPALRKNDTGGESTAMDLRIITDYRSESIGYRFKRFLLEYFITKRIWLRMIGVFLVSMTGLAVSVWFQLHANYFLIYPNLRGSIILPSQTFYIFCAIAAIYGSATLYIVIAIIFRYGNEEYERLFINKVEAIFIYSESQLNRRFIKYIARWWFHFRQLFACRYFGRSCWLSLTMLLEIILSIPFFLINKMSLYYYVFKKSEIIATRLCSKGYANPSFRETIFRPTIYIATLIFYACSVVFLWITYQVIVRMIITSAAFVMANGTYFTSYIGIFMPFIYFLTQVLNSYAEEKLSIITDILKVREQVEAEGQKFQTKLYGKLAIYLHINEDLSMELDLPKILLPLRGEFEDIFKQLVSLYTCELKSEETQVILYYNIKNYQQNKIVFSEYSFFLSKLNDQIVEILLSEEARQNSLIPIYYEDHDIQTRKLQIAIPMDLYKYLSYHLPKLSTSPWQLVLRITIITVVGAIFYLAAASFNSLERLNSLGDAVSVFVLTYATMFLGLKYIAEDVKSEKRQEAIKNYAIKYMKGYTFFYSRGISYNHCAQLSEIICSSDDQDIRLRANSTSRKNRRLTVVAKKLGLNDNLNDEKFLFPITTMSMQSNHTEV
ncbi:uncharacterized protein TRIADDRAFT_55359 [Trichoplax adhaerens]|uniref:Uncharacterized protein n=1 Tax=Trichoplax adhaerens TaxID=10228 RepID=B3RUP0_TRIAD|nr:predicted protein [Trichoplax adhaerens]EDV25855.1 predicted protein [Trichoplax adhaerens]|eukprot:XP_002111888.1 predicted protein [Trichoplax adhaerens]